MPRGVYGVKSGWPQEQVDELVQRIKDGQSSGFIAQALGVTRSAVVGKAHRLGLQLRGDKADMRKRLPVSLPPWAKRRERPVPKPMIVGNTHKSEPKRKSIQFVSDGALARIEAAPDAIGLRNIADMETHHCRYVVGDPRGEHGWCGAKRVEGLPYCETHVRRCYRPETPAEQRVAQPIKYLVVA